MPLDPRSGGSFSYIQYVSRGLAVAILALLIGKAAGGLAFAAAAGLQALGQVPRLQGLDSLHERAAPFDPGIRVIIKNIIMYF